MNKLILLLGAAAMAGGAPALAEGPGKGQGHKAHPMKHVGHKAKAKGAMRYGAHAFIDRNRNGIDDRHEFRAQRYGGRYGGAICPPGLAKKTPACVPPGQAKKMFRQGQRLPVNYRYYTPFDDIPLVLRERHDLDDDYRYIYRNNVIYVVDPRTQLITSIINAIL